KWEIRELWPGVARLGSPALGIETLGIGEPTRIALHHIRAEDADRFGRDRNSTQFKRTFRHASDGPGRRIQAHRFGKDHLRIPQLRQIRNARNAALEHRVYSFMQPTLA